MPLLPENLAGQRFGRLIAVSYTKEFGRGRWLCLCDCGKSHHVRPDQLKTGEIKSCGCGYIKHHHAKKGAHSSTYSIWVMMRQRTSNPNNKNWNYYGGRGIKCCERWHIYANFLSDMGEKPEGLSLDRINNDGDYSPENCRWADKATQSQNRRKNANASA